MKASDFIGAQLLDPATVAEIDKLVDGPKWPDESAADRQALILQKIWYAIREALS